MVKFFGGFNQQSVVMLSNPLEIRAAVANSSANAAGFFANQKISHWYGFIWKVFILNESCSPSDHLQAACWWKHQLWQNSFTCCQAQGQLSIFIINITWCYVEYENSRCHKPFCSVCIALPGRVTLQNSSSRGRLTLQPAYLWPLITSSICCNNILEKK